MKTFTDMTKKELQEVAKLYKLENRIEDLSIQKAKDAEEQVPKVPTNATYVEVLEAYKAEKAIDAPKAGDAPRKIGNECSSSGKSIVQVKRDYMNTKIPVIVTDNDNSSSTEEEIEGKIVQISWGNKRGKETSRIALNAGTQNIKEGAIRAMRNIKIPVNTKTKSTRTKKRFGIEPGVPLTEEGLEALKEIQKSKIAV